MIPLTNPSRRLLLTLTLPILLSTVATAQSTPDAGSISREFERSRKPIELPRQPLAPVIQGQPSPAAASTESTRFRVSGFKISGATVFTESELQDLLSDLTTREVSLADLQAALERVSEKYRQHGYFVARAYLPAQDIQNGIVAISILEGTVADIKINPIGTVRLDDAVIVDTMRTALPKEAVIEQAPVERGLLLLYDLPGIEARSTISPGRDVGTSTLTLDVTEGPLISGSVEADNFGNRFSGQNQLSGTLNINNPSGIGDQLKLRAAQSLDTRNARVGYQIPVGASGLRLGIDYTTTHYALCCEFAALNANGSASATIGQLLYPFIRSRDFNLYGSMSYSSKRFFNSAANVMTSDSRLDSVALGLSGNARDSFGGGGISGFGVSLITGTLNLDGVAADRAQDAATAQTHGRYRKLAYSLTRQQALFDNTTLRGNLSGQFASKNLASAEKFVLGGNDGVRAYPSGEGAGDEGWLLAAEVAHQWTPMLEVSTFLDHGEVLLHKDSWAGVGAGSLLGKNRYALSGAGFGLKWSRPGDYLLRGTLAFPVNDNPGRNLRGDDVDGKQSNLRVWLQAMKEF